MAIHTSPGSKVGRNDPCPCNSGKKYKKCHGAPPPVVPREVIERIQQHTAERHKWKSLYGEVREPLSIDFNGQKFVAVGNRLHYSTRWKTFHDFLFDYPHHVFGSGWWETEMAKPSGVRHTVAQWADYAMQRRKTADYSASEIAGITMDGMLRAFIMLAYDLYVIRNHAQLQKEVLRRLRRPGHDFTSARHELFVAATFIRAGFQIAFENERDARTTHPEFVATDPRTGQVLAVEAKAKNRAPGYAGFETKTTELLVDAARKRGQHPLAVFVDVALPPSMTDASRPAAWVAGADVDLQSAIQTVQKTGVGIPFDFVAFSNHPHLYGPHGDDAPREEYLVRWPTPCQLTENTREQLRQAFMQHGNIPDKFPGDHDDAVDVPEAQ